MLPLSELAAFAATVDREQRSDVADAVAAAWGLPAGAARFHRSSASHVFAVGESAYLRFVPATWRTRAEVCAVARLAHRLAERGIAVAAPIESAGSRLVETVPTVRGHVHATLVAAAPGHSVDLADLSTSQTYAWGAALARLHTHSTTLGDGLGHQFEVLDRAERVLAGDPPLAAAVLRIRDALAELPRLPESFGVVHGDFELDNLAWRTGGATDGYPTVYDFDDATRSWFAADVVRALRDLDGDPDEATRTDTFVAGYRSIRRLPAAELAFAPLFAAAYAAAELIRLPAVLDRAPAQDDPPWLGLLHTKLDARARRLRGMVLTSPARKRQEA